MGREDVARPAGLLDELRVLTDGADVDERHRLLLAKALYDGSRAAHGWGRTEESGLLLDELRDLALRPEASDDLRHRQEHID